jgi:hypothetical protein
VRETRNDLVGTFLRAQSKRANDISLRTAKYVADIKLSSAESVYRDIGHNPVLCSFVISNTAGNYTVSKHRSSVETDF